MAVSPGKLCKLWLHQGHQFSDYELVINVKDFPDIKAGDVVEIYHPDDEYNRLLLQVKPGPDDFQHKDTISIAHSIANSFQLRVYKDVYVNRVNPKTVALDLVELTYKEQYFSKADMWRLRQSLVNSCIYLLKKVHFAEMRAQAHELWSKGEKVTCGVVTEDTRVTFRSSTAQVNIFIQMSCEMWEFDNYGDLYFEKAIGGFLVELFSKWKEKNCNHDVTITLFSRTFYEATSLEDIPIHMRECVQCDHQGHFYEDFYRVVVQNERYDDWTPTVIQLKKFFIEYPKRVLHYHDREDTSPVRAWNSTAAQGNFLEVLNMALNAFEKHYLDRSFDRTGKLSIVITPGTGVFEVDRELMNITKQRTIDCGNGSDLVCMGEQPLHAVPLFKFYSKNQHATSDVGDDYNIPHWINHSFYTSNSQAERMGTCQFLPRIKMPQPLEDPWNKSNMSTPRKQRLSDSQQGAVRSDLLQDDDNFPFMDYDEYDAQVFKLPNHRTLKQSISICQTTGKHSGNCVVQKRIPRVRCNSDMTTFIPEEVPLGSSASTSKAICIPKSVSSGNHGFLPNSFGGCSAMSGGQHEEDVFVLRTVVGSAGSPVGHPSSLHHLGNSLQRRALINPFAPSRLHFKVTSNRRRWAHAFPTDPYGASIQPHHIHSASQVSGEPHFESTISPPMREVAQAAQLALEQRRGRTYRISEGSDGLGEVGTSRTKSVTISSAESGSEDSNSLKDPMLLGSKGLHHVSSAVSMTKVDSTNSLSSVLNMYDLHAAAGGMAGSVGSGGRGRSWTLGGFNSSRPPSFHRDLSHLSHLPRTTEEGHNWLWGITGEQEWTPETTTGMDWKSMTVPASLPITTDYFPDKRSLHNDYLVAEYKLLPDDVNSEWQRSLSSVRKPLTTAQVYREMVAQRIAQGFQLVMLPKRASRASDSSLSPYQQAGTPGTLLRVRSRVELIEEHILSIGRIFHRLSMDDNHIKVVRYSPRHPYPQKSFHYIYRFQVPDSVSYDVSCTNFTNEKLENYNWNHVDLYILTRGEEEYNLMESLKYWRARFCLLPGNNPATRKIIEGAERCDIYEEKTVTEQEYLIDGFIRFIEIMNKIKRPAQSRKPKIPLLRCHSMSVAPTAQLSAGAEKEKVEAVRRHSSGIPVEKGRSKMTAIRRHSLTQSPIVCVEKTDSRLADPPVKTKGMSKVSEMIDSPPPNYMMSPQCGSDTKKSAALPGSTEGTPGGSTPQTKCDVMMSQDRVPSAFEGLTVKSPLIEIRDAMLDPQEGLCFLNQQPGLPSLPTSTFIAGEAVAWVCANVDGVATNNESLNLLQAMIDEQLIRHASGNPRHRFVYGFFLYHIISEADKHRVRAEKDKDKDKEMDRDKEQVEKNKEEEESTIYPSNYYYNTSFQYEWCEVAIRRPTPGGEPSDLAQPPGGASFLQGSLPTGHVLATSKSSVDSDRKHEHNWGGRATKPSYTGFTSRYRTMGTPDLMLNLIELGNTGASPMYKVVNVDVDTSQKSDRQEWGTARYHGNYNPCCAFELEVQWLVATGCIMEDLVAGWSRKASSYGFQFLPIPGDPFALPFNVNSDPLRGPIFVPLDINSLLDQDQESLFSDYEPSTRDDRLLLFQESILKRFGFMPDRCLPNKTGFAFGEDPPQYVHCTGGMFVLLPDNKVTSPRNRDGTHRKPTGGTYLDYIAFQRRRSDSLNTTLSETSPEHQFEAPKVGFLWAWNYMLNKRWRTNNTGDEHFQDTMLADFRAFCSNNDNRLKDYWNSCHQWAVEITDERDELDI